MARSDGERKVERVGGEARDLAARAAADVGGRVARAWDAVRDRQGRERSTGSTVDFDSASADPETLFSKERELEVQALGHANILVIGQTGVGKSTLINAVFRKPLAKAETGKPVTKVIQRFEDPDVPVTLYDTKGVELGDSKARIIRDFRRLIARSRKAPPEQHIHLLWYCMDAGQTRVQNWDIEIIRALAEDVPVILVFTQTIDDERPDALEATVRAEALPIAGGRAVRTLAEPRRVTGGRTVQPVGLEELVRLTAELLPEAVSRAFANAQGVVIELKVDKARARVAAASAAAAAAAAAPLPGSDAAVLKPIQLGMLASVSAAFGIELTRDQVGQLLAVVVGKDAISSVGKKLVKEMTKHVPGGTVLNATVAAALTAALGEAFIRLCAEMLRRESNGRPMPAAEMVAFLVDTYDALLRKPERRGKPASEELAPTPAAET